MSDQVKPDHIKKTQQSLSKYIKKPVLTDKLLSKPPFRFLHDIILSAMKETGVLEGVFSPDLLVADNIKDRQTKIKFLDLLIADLKTVTSDSRISAKPSKIIAGLEVDKTLDLLLALAKAIDIKLSGAKKVSNRTSKKTNGKEDKRNRQEKKRKGDGGSAPRTNAPSEPDNKLSRLKENSQVTATPAQPVADPEKESAHPITNIERKSSAVKQGGTGDPISSDHHVPPDLSTNGGSDEVTAEPPSPVQTTPSAPVQTTPSAPVQTTPPPVAVNTLPDKPMIPQTSTESVSNVSSEPSEKALDVDISHDNRGQSNSLEKNENAVEKRASGDAERVVSTENGDVTSAAPRKVSEKLVKMKRPQSAKMRSNSSRQRREDSSVGARPGHRTDLSQPNVGAQPVLGEGESADTIMGSAPSAKGRRMLSGRPSSSRPGAPKPRERGQTTPVSNNNSLNNGEEVKTVAVIEDSKEENLMEEDGENLVSVQHMQQETDTGKDLDEGVNDVEETNQGALVSQILQSKKELERVHPQHRLSQETDMAVKRRSGETASKETEKLREGIQSVTRSSNPLGKLLHFLQEDVELMQSELQQWTSTNSHLARDIQLLHKQTEESLSPLTEQLADLHLLIEHQQESIRRIKSNIFLNSSKLDTLLDINNC